MITLRRLCNRLVEIAADNPVLAEGCKRIGCFDHPTLSRCAFNRWIRCGRCCVSVLTNAACYSTVKYSLVLDLSHGINVEEVKENCRQHYLMTGCEIQPQSVVQETLKSRADQIIQSLSQQEARRLQIIKQEHYVFFSEGLTIKSPGEMTNVDWLHSLLCSTKKDRFKYYLSLEHKGSVSSFSMGASGDHFCENPTSIFSASTSPSLEVRQMNHRLASAMQHGVPLIVDLDFVSNTSLFDISYITQQLWDMYCVNMADPDPFHLIFTGCYDANPIYRHMMLHHMVKTSFVLATFTDQSFQDLFPVQNLVYLSAEACERVIEFNHDVVYVIAAYYDPRVSKKLSFAKAINHKIRMLRFPISETVRWKAKANKDLDINHTVDLLLAIKSKMSWKDAFLSRIPMMVTDIKDYYK